MARARTAAILVEQKAEALGLADPPSPSEKNTLPQKVETDAATYTNPGSEGDPEVCLKGNPLKTTMEIRCGRCKLPRLLYPTDGVGARKPEPGKEYCKKRPYITKLHFDIYGQTFVPEGPGRGKKKKDFVHPAIEQAAKEGTPNGSQDSPNESPSAEGPIKPLSIPHSKCMHCNAFLPIKRMNNHMLKCIGGGGRDSSRNALLKMKNGNSNGTTPPTSRAGTPAPVGKDAKSKNSPKKREADDLESEDMPHKKKKVVSLKNSTHITPPIHMIKLKAPGMMKTSSQHSASNLSFEQRASTSEDEEYEEASVEGDDDGDGEYGSSDSKKPKKKATAKKKSKDSTGAGVKKVKSPKTGSKPILPPTRPSAKPKNDMGVNGKDRDAQSESSQTLSSPN